MELFKFHFYNLEEKSNHYAYPYFNKFVEKLIKPEIFPSSIIIEIGISNISTIILDAIANKYNGNFITCDNNQDKINTIINKLGTRTQIITESTIMFIYNLVTYIKTNDNFKNSKIHFHLNVYDTNLTDVENANIYLNCYYIVKSLFISGSQLLVNTNNNKMLISILKKEIGDDCYVNINDDNQKYLLFQWH